ncbi:MAG TPA: BadF/BadG/BcrA/BcrD ATPase family protein [Anaeromyxobacteraceae bacterium]|nr:BadF/BadG/BcrA/BcrD ATPase family protein [Anaeromyxobacteraceae bacterium]
MARYVGIDIGAETLKLVEAVREGTGGALSIVRRQAVDHGKEPAARLVELLRAWDWDGVEAAAVTGRLGRIAALPRLPVKQALAAGHRHLFGPVPATVVSIGSRGFSVLELHAARPAVHRENSRCAQGTGNFLRQLVDRFGLSVEQAARLADGVPDPAPLSGRCPVILKTDMTHLANKGEAPDRILAGLLDAIAENVEALVKPRGCPPRVLLTGGVARSRRVREHLRAFCERHGLTFLDAELEDGLFLEATGCAVHAAARGGHPPALDALLHPAPEARLELLPPLSAALGRVRRLAAPPPAPAADGPRPVLLGLDIGSTGAKAVAVDAASGQPRWEAWRRTAGDPVGAAQALVRQFLDGPAGASPVAGFGATGSGREIVGSLLATCYGADAVFVLNEIAAHARGALHHDPRVDTIFEIGGQDAKYIRLDAGRVVDAAMNEACSAGTGSFIEEQGRRFDGLASVEALARVAAGADGAVALGQHCSVFMAEVIDEAIAAGAPRGRIVAGLYDSVISNYLNRVKGSRSVGSVVFCQGMPFSADALAAAVARQTGAEVIVPPSPGTVGALGIALLASEALAREGAAPLDAHRLLEARLEKKDGFVCGATRGCGGSGNRCRIDRLTTRVAGERRRFTWGGACSLYDAGTRRQKLPDRAPDPFREREERVAALAARLGDRRGGRTVAMTDELSLKGLFPFFATFVHGLGFDLAISRGADRAALKRGIEAANVPFCAPMQQFHGLVGAMADSDPDLVLAPMLRELPRVGGERASQLCPVAQAAPDVLRRDLGPGFAARLVSPVMDVGPGGLDSDVFRRSCLRLAKALGDGGGDRFQRALREALAAQAAFDDSLLALGREALDRCARDGLLPIVVLGRTYTIHNDVLNSNLPAILREQGAIAIPIDCYPVAPGAPVFPNMFWAHGQRILRAAWQVRRTPGVYALFASNYSCGPDSFTLPFASRLMEGKPFAVVETDGHAGDAGTRTRVEAFLHCVREERRASPGAGARPPIDAERLTVRSRTFGELRASGEILLVPRMGSGAEVLAAAARGVGVPAEALPEPTTETLRAGRRHTSGKECLPLAVTLGSLLERVERPGSERVRFTFFMPSADGPCRFGAYKELQQVVLDRLGHADRVRIWAPPFSNYFQGVPPGFGALVLTGLVASDLLRDLHGDVRPLETHPGACDALLDGARAALAALVEREVKGELALRRVLLETTTGRLWGIPALLARTARDVAALRGARDLPRVQVTGEIYVRNDPFCTGDLVGALHRRGLRARVVPMTEYLYYSFFLGGGRGVGHAVEGWIRDRILAACHAAVDGPMGWAGPPRIAESVRAGSGYLRDALRGEAILTLGTALHAWRRGEIDAVVAAGPLECMPNKLAAAQLHHAAEEEGLLSLTLDLNGEPPDPQLLDAFAFEVHARHRERRAHVPAAGVEATGPLLPSLAPR